MPGQFRFRGKALSVVEPWASAIAFVGNNTENRSRQTHCRGPVAIHASLRTYSEYIDERVRQVRGGPKKPLSHWVARAQRRYGLDEGEGIYNPGHILAIAMLVDCVQRSGSPWFQGEWGWVLEGIVPTEPVPKKGNLGRWDCAFRYQPL